MFYHRETKEKLLNQRSVVIWITGLPSSGKTTLACKISDGLTEMGFLCQVLDGDMLRSGINSDLGFSMDDRMENIRRVAEIAKILVNNGIITICSFISPTKIIREKAKELIGVKNYMEVWLSTPLEVCEERDTHGFYKMARCGEIKDLTGITSVYEIPVDFCLAIDTSRRSAEEDARQVIAFILPRIRL